MRAYAAELVSNKHPSIAVAVSCLIIGLVVEYFALWSAGVGVTISVKELILVALFRVGYFSFRLRVPLVFRVFFVAMKRKLVLGMLIVRVCQ